QGAAVARRRPRSGLLQCRWGPAVPPGQTRGRGGRKWGPGSWGGGNCPVLEKIKAIQKSHGARSLLWSDGGGPFSDLSRALVRALGSPNYNSSDAVCARNVHHAALSLFGFGHEQLVYDFKNAKQVVLQTRNVFESIDVREVNNLLDGMAAGARLTVIDVRATVTAGKADRFLMIRPGTDYALNLAVINILLNNHLYNETYAHAFIQPLDALRRFVEPYTPAWAEGETAIKAENIVMLAEDLAKAAPAVIWHPGWMTARYRDSFHLARSAYIINALLGSVGAKGGLPLVNTPEYLGRKSLNRLVDLFPKVQEKRADGVGWKYPQFDPEAGLLQLAFKAMAGADPYPIKAYVAFNHDPLSSFPDPTVIKQAFDQLDYLVCVTSGWSQTAWQADLVLPLSTYLERESMIQQKNDLIPTFFIRQRCMEPRFDTKADWEIISDLARKLEITPLAFKRIDDLWAIQLEGVGVKVDELLSKGFVELTDKPIYRKPDQIKFPTASGRIEIVNDRWEKLGLPSLKPYIAPVTPAAGQFRLTVGRCALHSQGNTINNPRLNARMPENELWINQSIARKMDIEDGETVMVTSHGITGQLKTKLTEFIQPEAVFMVHGFGRQIPVETRALGRGLADNTLMAGGLDLWDPSGGGLALQEHFVTISKI
ncbi:MAG: molybdopterin-dependent oxidoreductase, partial [Deltaproteobacteria bacterium]|nr:molybdopterin-dependent oxidoreductase [Deltaproteobacteria bacterium]